MFPVPQSRATRRTTPISAISRQIRVRSLVRMQSALITESELSNCNQPRLLQLAGVRLDKLSRIHLPILYGARVEPKPHKLYSKMSCRRVVRDPRRKITWKSQCSARCVRMCSGRFHVHCLSPRIQSDRNGKTARTSHTRAAG